MNNDNEIHANFSNVVALAKEEDSRVYGTGLWRVCHRLAAARYPPAKEFFIKELDDPRWDWREVSISLLGFYFELETEVLNKIRKMAINDVDDGVKLAAIAIIGSRGKLPEPVLLHSLRKGSNQLIKEAAFSAILELCKLPYKIKINEIQKLRNGKMTPDLELIRNILIRENLNSCLELLGE